MILYRLCISPTENASDGENWDEWFSSLVAAGVRRAELIAADPCLNNSRLGLDYGIEKVELTDHLSMKKLVLAILNRRGYIVSSEVVVAPYRPFSC